MKCKTTLVKFMTEEELINMLVKIKNFRNPNTGKYHHAYRTNGGMAWSRAEYGFRLSNLDYVDVLLSKSGYVRYCGCSEAVLDMMKYRFGFVEE